MNHQGLDHLAMAVPSTEEAQKVWRDHLGLTVAFPGNMGGPNALAEAVSKFNS